MANRYADPRLQGIMTAHQGGGTEYSGLGSLNKTPRPTEQPNTLGKGAGNTIQPSAETAAPATNYGNLRQADAPDAAYNDLVRRMQQDYKIPAAKRSPYMQKDLFDEARRSNYTPQQMQQLQNIYNPPQLIQAPTRDVYDEAEARQRLGSGGGGEIMVGH